PGARELAARGVASSLAPANEAAGDALLADPQTSGGLLAGLPPARAEEALARLGASGHQAAVVGEVLAGPAGALTVAG
ncbi:MAG: AIR synthase-related protein, partial [Acetobacteraceae bacterium]